MKKAMLATSCALVLSGISIEALACGTVDMYSGMYFATDDPTARVLALKRLMCVTPLRAHFRARKHKKMLALVLRDAMVHPLRPVRAEARRVYCRYKKSEGQKSKLKELLSPYFGRPPSLDFPPLFNEDEMATISRLAAEGKERFFKRRTLASLGVTRSPNRRPAGLLVLRRTDGGEYEVRQAGRVRSDPEPEWSDMDSTLCSAGPTGTMKLQLKVKDPVGKSREFSFRLDPGDLGETLLFEHIAAHQPESMVTPAPPPVREDLLPPASAQAASLYPWMRGNPEYQPLIDRIPAPEGFTRVSVEMGSYGYWLRHLPLKPKGSPVRSYRGRIILRPKDNRLAAVVDLDLSRKDRQQCADTVMRLRGEYLRATGKAEKVSFRWPNIGRFGFKQWRLGSRPVKKGRRWRLEEKRAEPCSDYECFRQYLEYIFSWTGTMHLQGEQKVARSDLRVGDFFIQGGSPGHVVVLLDLAKNEVGELRALIGQGYMPAQDLHVLKPPGKRHWFKLGDRGVKTPFWQTFRWKHLRRNQ